MNLSCLGSKLYNNQLTSVMYFSVYSSGLQKHSEFNTVMVMMVSVA